MAFQLHQIKILIVEDNKPMLELLKTILRSFGVGTIITALNGEDGFERFCSTNPDLVIVDWMTAPWNGTTLSKKIRNDSQSPNQYVPIILMTGFTEKHRVIDARDSGITEFLVKPFNTRDLYKRIVQIVEKPRPFIRSESFFGPNRRKEKETYTGSSRRKSDAGYTEQKSSETLDIEMK